MVEARAVVRGIAAIGAAFQEHCGLRHASDSEGRSTTKALRKTRRREPSYHLDESIGVAVSSNEDLLRLDAALDTLAEMSPRQAKLVELRYYGGLKNSEIEALLGIGERTVERDWRAAKAWLAAEIRGEFR